MKRTQGKTKSRKWKDLAAYKTGCPYKGVAVRGTEEEIAKYHSGLCPGCNTPVKWEEDASLQPLT